MMVTKFQMDAMARSDMKEKDRKDFYLYVDEFQNFATDSFATILSEARKYKLNLVMANQYIGQMSEEVSGAVF
jgi:type IV secretory pathway TraG/TraD family ATPase VirD4